jgi:hypothetical protein
VLNGASRLVVYYGRIIRVNESPVLKFAENGI